MRSVASTLAALCLLVPCSGWAQANAQSPESAKQALKAESYLQLAVRLFKQGDFEGALGEFRRAQTLGDAVEDQVGLRYNIARCLDELGRHGDAFDAWRAYLELPDTAQAQARARARLKAIEPLVFGSLQITCDPADARVAVTGLKPAGQRWPATWEKVRAGEYEAHAERPDGARLALPIIVAAGEATAKHVDLTALPDPGTPATDLQAVTGPDPGEGTDPVPWLLAGGAGAALIAGGVFVALGLEADDTAQSAARTYQGAQTREAAAAGRQRVEEADADADTYLTLSYSLFAVGAGLGGAAVWMLLDAPSASASLRAGPGGLVWSGRW